MSLRHAMLGLLAERPRTGYDLLKEFESTLAHTWPASHSQIYPELARLAQDGLIQQTASGQRGAKTYSITGRGLSHVRHWLRESQPKHALRNDALLRVMLLWLLEPADAGALLRRELAYQRSHLADLEEIAAAETSPHDAKAQAHRVALEYGLATTRARIGWAEASIERIERERCGDPARALIGE